MLVTISRMSVPICNYFHVKEVNNSRITPFRGEGASISLPHSWGPPFTLRHEIWSRINRGVRLSYGENPKSLSHLGLKRYLDVTNRQTQDTKTELP